MDKKKATLEDRQTIIEDIKAKRMAVGSPRNVKEQIALETTKGKIDVQKLHATESSKEVAGKHLAKAGAIYLLVLVLAFIWSVTVLPAESVAVVAGLITLVVTNLSQILKGIVETKEQKDPIELMYDIAEKNSEACEREHLSLVESSARQQESILQTASANHRELVMMLKDAQEKQPTSLSIQPNSVVIKQGDNVVETSTKSNPPSTSPLGS